MSNGICAFTDCFAEMIGFAIIGVGVGVGGAYLLSRYGKGAVLPEGKEAAATAGLGRQRRRSRRRLMRPAFGGGGCGCGG